jgi:predicted AlkP superfamily pyrophosphatase or phosphodiesterase
MLAAALAVLATTASAIPPVPPPPPPAAPPQLLVVITVDQLSSDLFERYRPHFTGGFARLARGTVFRNGYQGHASTETCPGHAAIMTGTHPATNGIIANYWYDLDLQRRDKRVYCAEDPRIVGSNSSDSTASPFHLKVPTLGDLLKQRQPQSMNVAVAGKDRSAVMMSGRRVDQRWYWSGRRFATDLEGASTPSSVAAANSAVAAMIAAPDPGLAPPPLCAARARPVAVGNRSVGAGRLARTAGDKALFRASPAFDGAVLALSAALVQEMRLGSDAAPDILSIGLAATDHVGHRFGSTGQEMCLQLLSLDRDLGDFLQFLDRSGLDYAVALTSDHGVADLPERAREQGVTGAARVDRALEATALGEAIARKLNLRGPVLIGGYEGDIYISRDLRPADRARVLIEAQAFYRAHSQVDAVLTADELRRMEIPSGPPDRWSLAERARASFDQERSGDLMVLLRPNVTPIPRPSGGSVATHGSAWDYDRRVPIIFWRRGMARSERAEAVSTVDIMPTLASMLGLAQPPGVDGKCLAGLQGIACPFR